MVPVTTTVRLEGIIGLTSGDDAITLYNLGQYGEPRKGGGLTLSPYEILHLFEREKISVILDQGVNANPSILFQLFSSKIKDFADKYYLYKDLRNRGYVVKINGDDHKFFKLFARGAKINKMEAKYFVFPLKEGDSINLDTLNELIRIAKGNEKGLIIGLIDASGDTSYLQVSNLKLQPNKITQRFAKEFDWEKEKLVFD